MKMGRSGVARTFGRWPSAWYTFTPGAVSVTDAMSGHYWFITRSLTYSSRRAGIVAVGEWRHSVTLRRPCRAPARHFDGPLTAGPGSLPGFDDFDEAYLTGL